MLGTNRPWAYRMRRSEDVLIGGRPNARRVNGTGRATTLQYDFNSLCAIVVCLTAQGFRDGLDSVLFYCC